MKRNIIFTLLLALGLTALSTSLMAQQKIQLRSADKAECVKSDMTSLKATFSFSGIEAFDMKNDRGTFSTISMPQTVIGGNEGDPQIPVVNELIAVPFGATPSIRVTNYSTTDYNLEDYGIHKLSPRQPSLRKDQRPEEVPFVYNEAAYQTRGLRSEPQAFVSVEGTMRGIRLGKMTIEPVSYDPVNNTLRVFNNIEVEVRFDGADAAATQQMLIDTYSPYFDVVYAQMFNGRSLRDAYSDHPDLYTTPVKMLVITTATYANCEAFRNWVTWKKQKGIYVDVYTTAQTGTTAANIKSFIQTQYNQNHPTFLVIVGDTGDVTYSLSSSNTSKVTDLYYSSPDGDIFPDIFTSRMPVSSTTELSNLINKILTYEQYTMADPSYLSNVLLIAGSDGTWNPRVGQPTINYAADNYFNAVHGFTNVYKYLTSYTNCYNNMNTGIGFANYTAHGGQTGWSGPSFSVSDANNLTNNDKYFWAMGNCCLAADWGYSSTCLAEALLRSANKGAFGYIGSCPETYWWEDYYFGVGATTVTNSTPAMSQTQTGTYDAMFMDDMYNTLNSVPFLGNVAVTYAHANSYTSSVSDIYYWEAYHCLGDGSVMPYHVNPSANTVSHASTIGIGLNTFTVNALAGSYVSITKDNEILGVAQVGASGTVNVPITPITNGGDVLVVVTRQQRQPYMATIQAIATDGAYISLDDYTPTSAHVGDNANLSLTFKNVGSEATSGATTVTLTPTDSNVTIIDGTKTFGSLAANATTTVSGFRYKIAQGVADGTSVTLHYTAVNGSDTWEGNLAITADEAVLKYMDMTWDGGFTPGETLTVSAKFKNEGHYQATNAVATMTSSSSYVSISNPTVTMGNIAVDQVVTCQFTITIAANCPETAQLPVTFTMTADGGLSVQGTETLKNACNVVFNLVDSYGDGWNGNTLTVSFDDGTASQDLTISSGSSATYTIEIGNGTHVTLTWTSGSYANECSFSVSYEGDFVIYQSNGTPSAGVLYQFDCNCAAASQTFTVTVTSDNTQHGTVSGGGEFNYGQTCTVTATPAEGYMFTGWTQNGEVISSSSSYSFIVNSNMNLVAHFDEGLMIGDGGDATSPYLPSYNYYNYTLSQQIYTSDELGDAGNITSIAFYNGGAEKTRTCDFYLKATTKNSFTSKTDWITVSASDKVFSGSVTMVANDWTVIVFNTPFEYDGTSNLVLVTDDNTGAWTSSPHMTCRVFNTSATQAIYTYEDNTNFNPLSPSSGSYNAALTVKNQILLTKENPTPSIVNVTVSASPAQGGTVSGGGEYALGETCTVTATPAEGYYFVNWTQNNQMVSTEASYSFTTSNDMALVANFAEYITITVSANPAEGGTVNGGGAFVYGETCTVNTTVNVGYYFTGWTEDGEVVSMDLEFTFTAVQDRDLVATFGEGLLIGDEGPATNLFVPSYSFCNYSLTQQIYTADEIGMAGTITSLAFYNEAENDIRNYDMYLVHTDKTVFDSRKDWISVTNADKVFSGDITMIAGGWTFFTFDTPFVYDGTSNLALIMDDNTGVWDGGMDCKSFNGEGNQTLCVYSDGTNYNPMAKLNYNGTLMSEKNQILLGIQPNFGQTFELEEGWNWWSTNVNITLDDLKAALVNALPGTIIQIKSKNYSTNYTGTTWRGPLKTLDVTQMYMIKITTPCEVTITGMPINPSENPLTINYGVNWIGFPFNSSMSVTNAFAGFASNGDMIKAKNQYSNYSNGRWRGTLTTLEPGKGYIYNSTAPSDRIFIFPTNTKH